MTIRCFILIFVFLSPFLGSAQIEATGNPSTSKKIISRIWISGNKRTKEKIIYRELGFKEGDSIPTAELESVLERAKSNLVNTLLFNYVEVSHQNIDSTFCDVVIVLTERLYFWVIPVFQFADPNFNTWWLNKDFSRTNFGLVLLKKNFRGMNEDLGMKFQLGYSKEYVFAYRRPYLNKNQDFGGGLWMNYTQNNEITVATDSNKRVFYTGSTGNSRDELSIKPYLTYRKRLYNINTLELRYTRIRIEDTVTRFTSDYLPGNKDKVNYFGLYYQFRHDTRDNKGYPLTGRLSQMEFVWNGLPFMKDNGLNVMHVTLTHNEFYTLSEKLFFATQLKVKANLGGRIPYFFQEGLGYQNYVRGYEYYVIDGQHFGLFKSNFKYQLFQSKVHNIKPLEWTNLYRLHYAVYFNLYIDAGYVSDNYYSTQNFLSNEFIYGTGIGLDLVAYYDKVVRFEYSMNKAFEKGFFIHFMKPI